MSSHRDAGLPLLVGPLTGIATWLLGYGLTYLVVAPSIRDSALNRLIEAFEGAPATYEMVGWVFFNAHFVDTVFRGLPLVGSRSASFVGGQDGFTPLLYVVPVVLLLTAGLALAWWRRPDGPRRGALVGATMLPGYLLATIAGTVLFQVTTFGASGAPDVVAAVLLAGLAYPVVFGIGGGAIGGYVSDSESTASRERSV